MVFKIFEGKDEKQPEEVYLKMEQSINGGIAIIGCDKTGKEFDCGNILWINSDGTMTRATSCHVPGIQTGMNGQIAISRE